jgi:hypothetical protein
MAQDETERLQAQETRKPIHQDIRNTRNTALQNTDLAFP